LPFQHVKTFVKSARDSNRRDVTRLNWWKYGEKRPAINLELAEKEKRGEPVIGPWAPDNPTKL
jgi:hypothetical protein